MSATGTLAVLFSGGTDSTYAAMSQASKYEEIQLISFVRRGLCRLENPDPVVARLRRAFPDRAIRYDQVGYDHVYDTVTPHEEKARSQQALLQQQLQPLWQDPHGAGAGREAYDRDRIALFMTNECLQCKVAMHLAAIAYCRQRGIAELCDGGNVEQLDDGSQLEDVKQLARGIFLDHGIRYFSPALHVSAEERCRALFEAGITDQPEHKRLEKNHDIPSNQLQCIVSGAALWTVCAFPWMVYDGPSCTDYVAMCCNYYEHEMERWLQTVEPPQWQLPLVRSV